MHKFSFMPGDGSWHLLECCYYKHPLSIDNVHFSFSIDLVLEVQVNSYLT